MIISSKRNKVLLCFPLILSSFLVSSRRLFDSRVSLLFPFSKFFLFHISFSLLLFLAILLQFPFSLPHFFIATFLSSHHSLSSQSSTYFFNPKTPSRRKRIVRFKCQSTLFFSLFISIAKMLSLLGKAELEMRGLRASDEKKGKG